VKTEAESA